MGRLLCTVDVRCAAWRFSFRLSIGPRQQRVRCGVHHRAVRLNGTHSPRRGQATRRCSGPRGTIPKFRRRDGSNLRSCRIVFLAEFHVVVPCFTTGIQTRNMGTNSAGISASEHISAVIARSGRLLTRLCRPPTIQRNGAARAEKLGSHMPEPEELRGQSAVRSGK